MKHFLFFISSLLFWSCSNKLSDGEYVLNLAREETTIPVRITISKDSLLVTNAEERIIAENFIIEGDSIYFRLPVFNSEFKGKITGNDELEGRWYNYHKEWDMAFTGTKQPHKPESKSVHFNIEGKWETVFSFNTPDEYKAAGIFKQEQNYVTGTFTTETGDYRYLQGEISNDSLILSCFDGSHLYKFTAKILDNNIITGGTFYSGKTFSEPWMARRNEEFELRNADSLTYLKPGYDQLAFTFPDLNGKPVSFPGQQFKDKVTIIQLMGTWCPNCLDESKYFTELYHRYKNQGLEIVALAYEAKPDFNYAKERVLALKNKLNSRYTFLIAGTNNKEKAAQTLPMLNHVMSFPTTIFTDRNGKVVKIQTGFYGPGTGKYFDDYKKETESLIDSLLKVNQ